MKRYLAGEKFERIAIDITGPFPKSENRNLYILVVADYFSKFMEIFPLPNIEAETVADEIFKGWIKRYGEIHTDQGSQFESRLFREMCKVLQTNKTRTTAFHLQSDEIVERLNRIIKDMLSKYLTVDQTDWDRYVDGLVLAYNTTPMKQLGSHLTEWCLEVKLPYL